MLGIAISVFSINILNASDDKALDEYYAATGLYNEKMYDLAANEYKSFVAKYPNHPKILDAKLGLALSFYELKKFNDAQILFSELANERACPHKEQVHNLLGQCFLIAGKPQQAELAFRWSVNRGREKFFMELPGVGKATEESPGIQVPTDLEPLERSYAGIVEALYRQGKWDEVIKYADELSKVAPNGQFTSRSKFLAALGGYKLKQYKKTAESLQTLIKNDPNFPYKEQAYFLLADCQKNLGEVNKAIKNNEIVARTLKGKMAPEALFRMGYLKFMNNEYLSAIKDFDELRKKYQNDKNVEKAGIYLGRSYLELEQYKKAQAVFGELVDKGSLRAEATLWLSETFLRQEKNQMAADILKQSFTAFANDKLFPNLIFNYANALMGLKKFKEAAKNFAKVAQDYDEFTLTPDALRLKAFCENRAGNYSASLESCKQFLTKYQQNPSFEDVGFLNAENLFFMKQYNDAIIKYRQFIPWEGVSKYTNEAIFRIVQSLCEMKRWDDALTEAKPLLQRKVDGIFFQQLYYLIGLCYYNQDNWDASIRNFRTFIEKYPNADNADSALMKTALAYLKLKMPKDASEAFKRIVNSYQKSIFIAHSLTELGKIYFDRKEYDMATEKFKRVLKTSNNSQFIPQAKYYLAWIAMERNNIEKAIDLFQNVAANYQNSPFAPDSLYQQAILFLKQKKYNEAHKKFKLFLKQYSDNPKVELVKFYNAVALSKANNSSPGTAEKLFKDFIVNHPKSKLLPRALYESAWLAREQKKINQARDDYKALISEFPMSDLAERATFELAELEYEAKKYDDALALLDKLLAKGIDDDLHQKVLYREAWCFLARKQEQDALETFEKLLKDWPNSQFTPVAAYQAGEIRLKMKDFASAYDYFQKSVNSGGKGEVREQALLRFGEAQTLRDNWSGAKKTFETFMAEFPNSKFLRQARFWRGWSNENIKLYPQAISDYNAVLRFNIKDEISARAQFQLGETYISLKQYDNALKELVKVEINYARFKQWVARAKLEIGQVLDKQGKKKLAIEQYKKLVKKFPKSDEANLARELLVQHQVYIDE
jgi:TolA-binding protein